MEEVDLGENIQSNFQTVGHIVNIVSLPHCMYIYEAKHELSNDADRFGTHQDLCSKPNRKSKVRLMQ